MSIHEGLNRNDKLTNSTIVSSFDFVNSDSLEFEKKFAVLAKSCLKQNSKILVLPILEKCNKNVKKPANIQKEYTIVVPNVIKERTLSITDTSQLKNDWSHDSEYFGGDYFHKVESLLDFQHKFESEIKEKCQGIVKERNMKNNLLDIEDRLREYDEQISLNLLLKKNKDYTSPSQHHNFNNNSSLNFKDMRGPHCERCTEKNRKFEDSFLENLLNLDVSKRGKNKKKLNKLPSLSNAKHMYLKNESRENFSKSYSSFANIAPKNKSMIR